MISPARLRAYEAWRRSVPADVDRIVFDSAFEDVKARAAATITREIRWDDLRKACAKPTSALLLAVLQELIDEGTVREIESLTTPRYAPAQVRATTPDARACRRIWVTDDELVAINNLLETMRCPA